MATRTDPQNDRIELRTHAEDAGTAQIHAPHWSGKKVERFEVAKGVPGPPGRNFRRGRNGASPVDGRTQKFPGGPPRRGHSLFLGFFPGDNGAGLGASHQTGWTGLVAGLIRLYGRMDPEQLLQAGKKAAFEKNDQEKEKPKPLVVELEHTIQ